MNFKKIKQILLIIMTTYFMNGCSPSNDEAIAYFEVKYFAIEKLVDLDNEFQMVLEKSVSKNPNDIEISEEEYSQNIQSITDKQDSLKAYVDKLIADESLKQSPQQNLDRAYQVLINAYGKAINEEYDKLIHILKQENPDEEMDKQFNAIYQAASVNLNNQLDIFYTASEEYAKENKIEINWK